MTVTISNVRVWDGVADCYRDGLYSLQIENARIARLSRTAASREDASVRTVMPGLIDAHVHLTADPDQWSAKEIGEDEFEEVGRGMEARATSMVRAGITTARDLGGGTWLELDLRDRIAAGLAVGPRLLCAGQPLTSPGGHCHFWGGEAEGEEAVRAVIARQLERGVDLIKVMASGGQMTRNSDPLAAQFGEEALAKVVAQARKAGRYVAAHCHGTQSIKDAAASGVRTVEHCSWRGAEGSATDYDPAVAARMAADGTWVSPTISTAWQRFYESNPDFVAQVQANFRAMREAGIKLIASTDAGVPGVHADRLAYALPVFADFAGLSPVETLRSATSDSAEALGLDKVTGRIENGLEADLLVVEGDPLSDLAVLTEPVAVVARGRVVVDERALFTQL